MSPDKKNPKSGAPWLGRAIPAILLVATAQAWASVTVTLTAPAGGSIYASSSDIALTADASAGQGFTLSKVEFFSGTSLIGTDFSAPYGVTWAGAPLGQHSLTAKATAMKKNNPDQTATSPAANITVNAQLRYVHTDHLNTPRLIADSTGTTVWRHDNAEPFGDSPADENPSGLGAFEFPLGLGGYQYRDKESDRWYNWFRSYAAALGRFEQSDRIGLQGGLNTYLYVDASPLKFVDPTGEALCDPSDTMCGTAMRNAGIPGPHYPVNEPPPAPVSCDGRWIQVRFTRNLFSWFTGSCTCYWSCYSCPGGSDAFPYPNLGQHSTPGKLFFDPHNYGKDFNPKKGDKCLCPKPGPESSCGC